MTNVDIVKSLYESFGTGDIAAVLDLLDPDVEWIEPDLEQLPYQGITIGARAVAEQVFAAIPTTYDHLSFEPTRWLGSGDTVAVLGVGTATGRGGTHRFRFAHVIELASGRVVRMNGYADTHRLAASLTSA